MDEGERPACDGLAEDGAGNIYFGSFEQRSLLRREPDGRYELLAHDDRFGWPDGLAYHDGWLYVTLGQWNRLPAFNDGKELRKPPYLVVRMLVRQNANRKSRFGKVAYPETDQRYFGAVVRSLTGLNR